MKKLAVFAVAAIMAASAFADYGFYNESSSVLSIGGYTGAWTAWGTEGNNQLGTLNDLVITQLAFNMWDESQSRSGGNLVMTLWQDGVEGSVGNADWHFGALTAEGGNNYSLNWTGSYDVAAEMGVTLVDDTKYYLDVKLHTYGGSDEDLPKAGDGKFHTEFTYQGGSAVPEPATMSLLGLGALAMVLRRKLRK